jgi:phosphatidylglycerol:prolipoprotein diacylglycerol transferase
MFPDLIKIPGTHFAIHSFGLMLVVGLLVAMEVAKRLAKRRGLDGELFVNAGILALLFGIAGARLSHVLENFSTYTNPERSFGANLWDAVNITSGGLTYYGGLLLATPALIAYAIWKRIPVRVGMDIIAPCLMIGLAFGRIGCFLNGCCYGAQCDLPWAVTFPYQSFAYSEQVQRGQIHPNPELRDDNGYLTPVDQALNNPLLRPAAQAERSLPVHPAQLYSAATAFLLAAIALAYYTMPHAPGRVFALTLMLEGIARFLLESVRAEPPVFMSLSFSQILGPAITGGGMLLWILFGQLAPRVEPSATPGFPVAA